MSEVFRIYLPFAVAAAMPRQALRGYWETQVIEQGGVPEPGGVTVRQFGNRVSIAGRASRKLDTSTKISPEGVL